MCLAATLAACAGRPPVDSDTGTPDTEVADTDTDVADTDTDVADTDTDVADTDTDVADTDEPDPIPCDPAPARDISWERRVLAPSPGDGLPAMVTHVQTVELYGTGRQVLVSDAARGTLTWFGGCADGSCERRSWKGDLLQPTRTHVVDLDGDGLKDIVVADIGQLFPTPEPVGLVRVFWGDSGDTWKEEVILEFLGRTVCAEPGDLDGDGDLDLVVCEFGALEGSLLWLEQDFGGWTRHELFDGTGPIDAWPVDLEGDGDLDVVSLISQYDENIALFTNLGDGTFVRSPNLFDAPVDYYGSSGLRLVDWDRDRDLDFVLTNGDSLDLDLPIGTEPKDHYGVQWVENQGRGRYVARDIARHWGAYTSRPVDLDQDCDMDVVVTSFQDKILFQLPHHAGLDLTEDPLFWLEQTDTGWERHSLPEPGLPTSFAVEVVDLDGDGLLDVVSGPVDLGGQTLGADQVVWWRQVATPRE
jgi:hypothetical protein